MEYIAIGLQEIGTVRGSTYPADAKIGDAGQGDLAESMRPGREEIYAAAIAPHEFAVFAFMQVHGDRIGIEKITIILLEGNGPVGEVVGSFIEPA